MESKASSTASAYNSTAANLLSKEHCRGRLQWRRMCRTTSVGVQPFRSNQHCIERLHDQNAAVGISISHFSRADDRGGGGCWVGRVASCYCREAMPSACTRSSLCACSRAIRALVDLRVDLGAWVDSLERSIMVSLWIAWARSSLELRHVRGMSDTQEKSVCPLLSLRWTAGYRVTLLYVAGMACSTYKYLTIYPLTA